MKALNDLKGWLLISGIFWISSCAVMNPGNSGTSYSEDLTVHRPTVALEAPEDQAEVEEVTEVDPEYDQTSEVDEKLAGISSANKASRTAPGFTIQVYSGTSREQASQAKSQVYKIIPESRPETKYEQPIYRVRVGEYGNRLEAQNTFAKLQKEFPQAIVIPSRIRVN